MAAGGKGTERRPQQVSEEQAEANWNKIFGKKEQPGNHLLKDDEMGFTPLTNHIGNDE
jgi:hypothetical protein